MHQPPNDKGWLRARIPNATAEQIYCFIERVGKNLDHLKNPTAEQIEHARQQAFAVLTGTVC